MAIRLGDGVGDDPGIVRQRRWMNWLFVAGIALAVGYGVYVIVGLLPSR